MEKSVQLLVLAMFVQSLFPMVILLKMFITKTKAVKAGKIKARSFKLNDYDDTVPTEIIVVSNHYTNLFEMPLIFLIVSSLFIALKLTDNVSVVLAWLFVMTRLVHSYIHLGKNYLPHRYTIFGVSCLSLLSIWLYLLGKIFLA